MVRLSSLEKKQPINIQNLAVEKPLIAKEYPLASIITDYRWNKIAQEISQAGNGFQYLWNRTDMDLLAQATGHKPPEVVVEIKAFLELFHTYLSKLTTSDEFQMAANGLMALRQLFGSELDERQGQEEVSFFNQILGKIDAIIASRQRSYDQDMLILLTSLSVAYPPLHTRAWREVEPTDFGVFNDRGSQHTERYVRQLAQLKILFPDRVGITDSLRVETLLKLDTFADSQDWQSYCTLSSDLAILLATSVDITRENGVVLHYAGEQIDVPQAIPTQRSF